jgi:hypothetical protein
MSASAQQEARLYKGQYTQRVRAREWRTKAEYETRRSDGRKHGLLQRYLRGALLADGPRGAAQVDRERRKGEEERKVTPRGGVERDGLQW